MNQEAWELENKSPEEIKRKLAVLRDRIHRLSELDKEYSRRMLKFGFAAWVFGLSTFIVSLVFLRGFGFTLQIPAISISLLVGAGAAPLAITVLMLQRQRRMKNRLESMEKLVGEIYRRRIAEEEGEFLHSLLEHNIANKIAIASSSLNQLVGERLTGRKGRMAAMSLKAVTESSELLKKARLLKRIGKSVVVKMYDLNLAITRAIEKVKPEADERGVKITYEKTDAFVQGSPILEELFFNLMENSIRHANCKRVKISVKAQKDHCVIQVDDDGKGIPDELKKKIFRKGLSEGRPGRGIALYLVKKIVEIYGGNIWVMDSPLGGTRFKMLLRRIPEIPGRHAGRG
jgi:signal transduction histidine kinase